MIFQYTFQDVLAEKKTQTRRLIKADDAAVRGRYNKIEAVTINGRLKWAVGRTYAVQTGRTQPAIARVEITALHSQKIRYISTADSIQEGFRNRQDFLTTWREIHGEMSLDRRVWIISFKLVSLEAAGYPLRSTLKNRTKTHVYASVMKNDNT
jgi:hypothetical protein